ncbi:MAG: ThuA domain-containing protein [Planctomycetaceae bacterium]|nr:ThuA domain-containing protein [Planctomycetaceae bacterium]
MNLRRNPRPLLVALLCLVTPGLALTLGTNARRAEAADPPAERTKFLLIGHDKDGHPRLTHEYLSVCQLLAKCLRQTPGVETVVSNRWPQNDADLQNVKAIVLYVPWGSNILFDGPHRDAARKLLDSGVGLSAIHWATGAERDEFGALWLQYMGGWFHTDFSKIQHIKKQFTLVEPEHPIFRGGPEKNYELFDEFYFDLRFDPNAKPLVTVDVDGRPNTIAWTFERTHGGRSFGFDAGHYHKNFGDDAFRRFVVNGILWTAHREIPPTGAPAAIEPADLEIPPAAEAAQ